MDDLDAGDIEGDDRNDDEDQWRKTLVYHFKSIASNETNLP